MFKLNFQSERSTDGTNLIKHTRNIKDHTYHVFVIPESLSETCIPPSPGDIYIKASNKRVCWVSQNGDVIEWKGNSGPRAKFHFGKTASVLWWNGQDIGWFPPSTVSTHTTLARGGNVDWAFITSQAAEAIVCAVQAGKVRKPHKRRRVELGESHNPPHHLESRRIRSSGNIIETRASHNRDESGQDIATEFTTLQDNSSAFDLERNHTAGMDALEGLCWMKGAAVTVLLDYLTRLTRFSRL